MNKKAEFNKTGLISIIVLLVMIAVIVTPLVRTQEAAGEYVCEDAATFDYNVTLHLCVNESQTGHPTNSTPVFDYDLNSSERTVLSLSVIFLVLGLIYIILKSVGLTTKK